MKKRLLALFLALALCLGLTPALAAEGAGFTDVPSDAWFAPYVDACVAEDLMNGVGDNLFAPDRALTNEEALVMAARLTWRLDGGTGDLPKGGTAEEFYDLLFPEQTEYRSQEIARYEKYAQRWSWDGLFYLTRRWLETIEQDGRTYFGLESVATRMDYFQMLLLPLTLADPEAINTITDLPDLSPFSTWIWRLYEAGIVTGTDEYGTCSLHAELTRAQAAAQLVRFLRPEMRVKFTPKPLPTDGYTLTYLADGTADCGVEYPILPLSGTDGGAQGLLTLDGQLLPWPEGGVPSFGLYSEGGYLHLDCWNKDTPEPWDTTAGMLDAAGEWVIPLGIYSQIHAVPDGFLAGITGEDGAHWYRLDRSGRVVEDLEAEPDWETVDRAVLEHYRGIRPVASLRDDILYYSESGVPVSQKFDWASQIGPDGTGFVGLDGKIYRIDYAK